MVSHDRGGAETESTAAGAGATNAAEDIRQVITRAFKDQNVAVCTEVYTQRVVEQLTGAQGSDALRQCRDETKTERPARTVRAFEIAPTGEEARAIAVPDGGDSDGLRYQISLTNAGGIWRIDHLERVKVIDRSRVDADFAQGIAEEFSKYLSRGTTRCISSRILGSLSNARLERIIVTGNHTYGLQAYQQCGALRPLFVVGLRKGLAKSDIPKPVEDCVVESLSRRLTDRDMAAVLRADAAQRPTPRYVIALTRRTAIACATHEGQSS